MINFLQKRQKEILNQTKLEQQRDLVMKNNCKVTQHINNENSTNFLKYGKQNEMIMYSIINGSKSQRPNTVLPLQNVNCNFTNDDFSKPDIIHALQAHYIKPDMISSGTHKRL